MGMDEAVQRHLAFWRQYTWKRSQRPTGCLAATTRIDSGILFHRIKVNIIVGIISTQRAPGLPGGRFYVKWPIINHHKLLSDSELSLCSFFLKKTSRSFSLSTLFFLRSEWCMIFSMLLVAGSAVTNITLKSPEFPDEPSRSLRASRVLATLRCLYEVHLCWYEGDLERCGHFDVARLQNINTIYVYSFNSTTTVLTS